MLPTPHLIKHANRDPRSGRRKLYNYSPTLLLVTSHSTQYYSMQNSELVPHKLKLRSREYQFIILAIEIFAEECSKLSNTLCDNKFNFWVFSLQLLPLCLVPHFISICNHYKAQLTDTKFRHSTGVATANSTNKDQKYKSVELGDQLETVETV